VDRGDGCKFVSLEGDVGAPEADTRRGPEGDVATRRSTQPFCQVVNMAIVFSARN